VTGSIGVVAARVGVEPLLERLGVRTEVVRRGARAGLLSPSLPLGEDERVALRRELDATYDTFLSIVTAGRKLPREEVEKLARGRVYTGTQAHEASLVDVLGGFDVALRELRALVADPQVGARAEPQLVRAPRRVLPLLEPPAPAQAILEGLRVLLGRSAAERDLVTLALAGERVLLLETRSDILP
jgi:protease IV